MFSSGPNYNKLKTNLRLALNRLKLLEKKKSELTQKARKEIADYIAAGKPERARIRVEHIIREDYLVEAMEIVEMYCDLVLARYGLVTQMKELDDGIAEAVASLIWVAPRLQADVQELKNISDVLTLKYGKLWADEQRSATGNHRVSEKLLHKMAIQAPPKLLVEKYLIEIAKIYNIEYEPDPQVINEQKDGILIDLSDRNNLDGSAGAGSSGSGGGGGGSVGVAGPVGFIGYPQPPPLPQMPQAPTHRPFDYPAAMGGGSMPPPPPPNMGGGGSAFAYNIPPNPQGPSMPPAPTPSSSSSNEKKDLNTHFIYEESTDGGAAAAANNIPPPSYESLSPDDNMEESSKPKPQPRSKMPPHLGADQQLDLPNVPLDLPDIPLDDDTNNDEIDLDDLSKRFEELKRRK